MKNGSFFTPREHMQSFFNPADMKGAEGLYVYWETDPIVARRVLPPPLEPYSLEHPLAYASVYIVREPGFSPWYMESCIGLYCRYRDIVGVYSLNFQLSGLNAQTAMFTGREHSGLPKKMCERITVERNDSFARAVVEAKGLRIFDVELEVGGSYNDPALAELFKGKGPGYQERGPLLTFQYDAAIQPGTRTTFPKMRLINYDSVTDWRSWEPARINAIEMAPSLDDPWAEVSVVRPLGAAYGSVQSNRVLGLSTLAEFEGEEADNLFSWLMTGFWDRSTIRPGAQRYGQF